MQYRTLIGEPLRNGSFVQLKEEFRFKWNTYAKLQNLPFIVKGAVLMVTDFAFGLGGSDSDHCYELMLRSNPGGSLPDHFMLVVRRRDFFLHNPARGNTGNYGK